MRHRRGYPGGYQRRCRKLRAISSLINHDLVAVAHLAVHVVDASHVAPHVTWGTSPDQVVAIDGHVPDPLQSDEGAQRRSAEQALRYTG